MYHVSEKYTSTLKILVPPNIGDMRHYIGFIFFCLVFKFVFVYFFEILPELVMGAKQIYHLSSDENDPSHIGYNNLRFPLIFFYNILYF